MTLSSPSTNWYLDNRNGDTPANRFAISTGGADMFTLLTSGNVGIGTSSPLYRVDIVGTNNVDGMRISSGNATTLRLDTGRAGAKNCALELNVVAAGDFAVMQGVSTGDDPTTGFPRLYLNSSGNIGIGTTAPQYKLSVNGTIGTKEVIVTNTGWADYVFKPNYRLRPLTEIAAYIDQHHHLPEIPSEGEIQEKGVSLGDMQVKLLAKIEELTLHVIQADEKNRKLQERIARLEARGVN